MSHGIFDDWRYRYSRVYASGKQWRYFTGRELESKPLRLWNPAHLARFGLWLLWVRKYW